MRSRLFPQKGPDRRALRRERGGPHRGAGLLLAALLLLWPALGAAAGTVRHELKVRVDPEGQSVTVRDRVTLPADLEGAGPHTLHFLLHGGLDPQAATEGVSLAREGTAPVPGMFLPGPEGLSPGLPDAVPAEHFTLRLPEGTTSFVLEYGGKIHHPVTEGGEEYARGFGVTPGLVSSEGAYLCGSTLWVPWFGPVLLTFSLEAETPPEWSALSQGRRTASARDAEIASSRWESPEPQGEIYLVAGPWTEYHRAAGDVETQAFLRTPDPELAARYLDATARYLDLYSDLIGPYPYGKFSLVENFWETGYGMPSFTLLGPSVIRFPFILNSSYPHEILHNWWGNGVYVDDRGGNWSEGLTAYLADHLLQEQKGEGVEYRQTTLQKYADYAARAKDFPLTQFVSRHSSATEAVGYGKALFFFHMLRAELGDGPFVAGLRRFYEENRFRAAGYADLVRAFETTSGRKLQVELQQWVERPGAPSLGLRDVKALQGEDGFVLSGVLVQTQEGEPYRLGVPVAVTLEGREEAFQAVVRLENRRSEFALRLPGRPLRVDVDPEFDVFRRLALAETPPALSGLFGAERSLIVLPAAAPEPLRRAYRELAESWSAAQPGAVEIATDDEVRALPPDRAVWVFGWENRLRDEVGRAAAGYGTEIGAGRVRLGNVELARAGHAVVVTARNPAAVEFPVGWLASDLPEALPGLGRKLPHYHKWSYLAFEGAEPSNVAKGRWPVVDSPLTAELGAGSVRTARARLAPRRALADLPAVFSQAEMLEAIRFLAADDLKGRALGTPELDRAAEFIAEAFRAAGLRPAGDGEGSYFQTWTERVGEQDVVLRNVLGVLPGSKTEWEGQSVVVSAHYDGQGFGLPAGRTEDRGKLHPGADDNGSGVAVLSQLAKTLAGTRPSRAILFAAFTGEEGGRLGSRHFVSSAGKYPAAKALGVLNVDTVGRLGKGKLLALGCGSAREWVHIFTGAGYTTATEVECVPTDPGGSDQVSFLDAGVPAVQLFSGPHLDYHRPSDTPDRVDVAGLVKVAAVAKEAVEYLASRPGPLTVAGQEGAPSPAGAPRKVSLGTVPDFAHQGEGVRLSGVVPGSPAERAGLREGDVLTALGKAPIRTLRDLSVALASLGAGDAVEVTFRRNGEERKVEVRVDAR